MRIVDTRHESSATFAAEAYAKLTRKPGLAVLTAGPGVTNGISAVTSAHFNGSPLVVLGGRAPAGRWGAGSLQELDQPPILAPITKLAATVGDASTAGDTSPRRRPTRQRAAPRAGVPRLPARRVRPVGGRRAGRHAAPAPTDRPIPTPSPRLAKLIADAERPAFLVGSDAYWDGAWGEFGGGRRAARGAVLLQRSRSRACSPPTIRWRSCAPVRRSRSAPTSWS